MCVGPRLRLDAGTGYFQDYLGLCPVETLLGKTWHAARRMLLNKRAAAVLDGQHSVLDAPHTSSGVI